MRTLCIGLIAALLCCCSILPVHAATPSLTVEKYYFKTTPLQYAQNRLYVIVTAQEDYVGYITISYLKQGIETILIQKQWVSIIAKDHAGIFTDVAFDTAGDVELKVSVIGLDNSILQAQNDRTTITVAADIDKDGVPNQSDSDNDNDGLSDAEESSRGTNPFASDTDNDGLSDNIDPFPTNAQETKDADRDGIGDNADTDDDNDGLTDVQEIEMGTNPLQADTDNDGVSDAIESSWGTDPNRVDTDGDGVSDVLDPRPKDPTKSKDTDGDKIADEDEIANGLNPNDPSDALKDADRDGLSNLQEVVEYATDPQKSDSDGDSLADGYEVVHRLDPKNRSDAKVDSDGDGISNDVESIFHMDPQKKSTYVINDLLFLTVLFVGAGVLIFVLVKRSKIRSRP